MTRRQLLAEMTSEELAWWQARYRFKPFGQAATELQAGLIASAVINTLRAAHFKDPVMTDPIDFVPFVEKPEPTDEEREARLIAALGALGAPI